MTGPGPRELALRCLPELAGLPLEVETLSGGGNNRLYRLQAPGRDLVLKHYFRHPAQPRDRLGAEFAFLEYAWRRGVRCVPRPLARDEAAGVGLYAYLEGRAVETGEIGRAEVGQALGLLEQLNAGGRPGAGRLGAASEACFTVEDHLALLEMRLERLSTLQPRDALDAEAAAFVADELRPAWLEIRRAVRARLGAAPPAWAETLPAGARVLSPSDFGFHNALRLPGGRLAFLDFEYAGWDDPAKLACDFFFQPARPAPRALRDEVTRAVAELAEDAEGTLRRIELLWPVVGLKWCCILLNHFSSVDLARRLFAAADALDRRPAQLEAARRLLRELTTERGG